MERVARHAPGILLGVALLGAGALILVLTSDLTFFGDSWAVLMERREPTLDALLDPHNEHIVLLPTAITQLVLRLFGMESATPEYVLLTIGLLGTATLLFLYVGRRLGSWPALFAAVLLLFLGPAYEVLLWSFEIGFVGSVFFGLASVLALERGDRRGDIAACAFLIVALGFSSLGIPFAAAAAVTILQGPHRSWLRRAFVVAVPVALFAAWYLGWGDQAESHLSLRNVLASPRFVADTVAVAVGAVFGLGTNPVGGSAEPVWGRALLVALVAFFAYRQVRKPGVPTTLWPVAAAAATNWFLMAFNNMPGRDPVASRYQYVGAVFVLMLLANLLRGVRFGGRAVVAVGALVAAAVATNVVVLKDGENYFEAQTVLTRADTAAIEIARRTVAPEFQLTPEVAGTPSLVNVYAEKYFAAVDEYGSPAYTPAELAVAPEAGRRQADIVLAMALPLSTVTRLGAYDARGGENCLALPTGNGGQRGILLSPGLTRIEVAPGPDAAFTLRRFAQAEYPVSTEGAPGDSVTLLRIPADAVARPWYLRVEMDQEGRVCRSPRPTGSPRRGAPPG